MAVIAATVAIYASPTRAHMPHNKVHQLHTAKMHCQHPYQVPRPTRSLAYY